MERFITFAATIVGKSFSPRPPVRSHRPQAWRLLRITPACYHQSKMPTWPSPAVTNRHERHYHSHHRSKARLHGHRDHVRKNDLYLSDAPGSATGSSRQLPQVRYDTGTDDGDREP